jgi:hypothetical protein
MNVLLVDPYYLTGHSPPSWILGQLEAQLTSLDHAVSVSDFCTDIRFASLAEFRIAETAFLARTAELAAAADAVYITTSFGIPQKPTPILERVARIAETIARYVPGIPIIAGGAQVQYLLEAGVDVRALLSSPAITELLRNDLDAPAAIERLAGRAPRTTSPLGLRHCTWSAWDLAKYPSYRAILTSLGCRYGCSFCFESKQQFQQFELDRTMRPYLDDGSMALAVEDSTVVGAHGARGLLAFAESVESPVEFTCYALVTEVDAMDLETLIRLRRRGMISVILGIETPDSETLRLYRKSVRPPRVRGVLSRLHEAGIATQGCLMAGIPEVSLSDTMYTLDYALDLEIDVRRWHIFQPSFVSQPERIRTPRPLSIERFAMGSFNIPDHLIPEMFAEATLEWFLEEHFLVRAIPYVTTLPEQLDQIHYDSGYTLGTLYGRIVSSLRGTKESFNEEDYYRVLTREHSMYGAVIDRQSVSEQDPG